MMSISIFVIFITTVITVVGIWGVSVRNSIIVYENKVKRAWSDVLVYEQQKNKIIPKLEFIVKQFENYESDFQSKIVELRNETKKLSKENIDLDKLRSIEDKSEKLLSSINVTVENYPELKADSMFVNLMTEIIEQQENISSSIKIFNNNIEIFNTNIEVFPNNIINDNFNKKHSLKFFKSEIKSEYGNPPAL